MRMFLAALLAVLAGALSMWGLRMTYRYFSAIPWESLARRQEARRPMAPMALPGRPAHPRLDYFGGDGMLRPLQGPYEAAPPREGAPTQASAPRRTARTAARTAAAPARKTAAKGGRRPVGSLLQMLQSRPGSAGAAAAPASGGFDSAAPPPPASAEEDPAPEGGEPGPGPAPSGPARERTRRSVGAHGSRVIPESPAQEASEADGSEGD